MVMCMETRQFQLETYIGPAETFHFARKVLTPAAPSCFHFHNYFEVFIVEKGCVRHLINGSAHMLAPGDTVFIRPGDRHALQALGPQGCRIINVLFRPSTADHLGSRYRDEFAGCFFWREGILPDIRQIRGPRMERAINSALELQGSLRTLARIEEFLLNLMTRVVDFDGALAPAAPAWLVSACIAARSAHVFRRGAAGFVDVATRGHAHVCRETRRHLGLSPLQLVNRIRMEHAAMCLGDSTLAVEDIAAECGIADMSYFYRLFRAHYGTTPRKYRLRHAQGARGAGPLAP